MDWDDIKLGTVEFLDKTNKNIIKPINYVWDGLKYGGIKAYNWLNPDKAVSPLDALYPDGKPREYEYNGNNSLYVDLAKNIGKDVSNITLGDVINNVKNNTINNESEGKPLELSDFAYEDAGKEPDIALPNDNRNRSLEATYNALTGERINNLKNAKYPKRGKAAMYEQLPYPDDMDYRSDFEYNPFASVKDYTTNTSASLANIDKYIGLGATFADTFNNPFKQKYFTDREESNLAEDARRKTEDLRYSREKDKYSNAVNRRNTLSNENRTRWDDEQKMLDTEYSDEIDNLKYIDSINKEIFDLRKGALDRQQENLNNELAGRDKLFEFILNLPRQHAYHRLDNAKRAEIDSLKNAAASLLQNYDENSLYKARIIAKQIQDTIADSRRYVISEAADTSLKGQLSNFLYERGWLKKKFDAVSTAFKNFFDSNPITVALRNMNAANVEAIETLVRTEGSSGNFVIPADITRYIPQNVRNRLLSIGIRPDKAFVSTSPEGDVKDVFFINNGKIVDIEGNDIYDLSTKVAKDTVSGVMNNNV